MKDSLKDAYTKLNSLKKLALLTSAAVVILFVIIRMDENVSLWVMIAAVVIALFDAMLVIGYAHNKDELSKRIREREDAHE
jgi:hypothetical protein